MLFGSKPSIDADDRAIQLIRLACLGHRDCRLPFPRADFHNDSGFYTLDQHFEDWVISSPTGNGFWYWAEAAVDIVSMDSGQNFVHSSVLHGIHGGPVVAFRPELPSS